MEAHAPGTPSTLNLLDASAPGILTRRGIADAADAMRWQAGKDGWCYPVYDLTGAPIARRWKNYDSNAKDKYFWRDGTNAQYYHVGARLQQAIADANGLLYIANGEPAVLTFHAAGLFNVLSFFGESHAPESLVDDLRALGVETVRYYPDKDQPGRTAAGKLRDRLDNSGITLDCRVLPDELPAKADTNDLWQFLQFDQRAFSAALNAAPAYDLPAPAPVIRQHEFSREITGLDHRDEFISTVVLPAIERAAMEGKRVAVASFGVASGQAIADQLSSVIDDPERVLFVHADNSGEERQAAFLRDPNGEASKYQVIVYSPVIGTGYSIEPPFDVLVALASQEQSAEDARQFVGRFRNVTETYVWLPNNQDTRETNAQAISERLITAAERTAHPFIADGRLQRAISTQARQFVESHAAVRAARNASMNDLRQRFVRLCASSYTVRTLDGDDQTTAALINARMTEIDDNRRALALTAAPVDADAYKRKQDAGRVTEPEHAGHIRWQIETMTGLKISPELRDRLWTEHRRKAAQRFADLLDDITALQLADMEQAQDDTPLHRRAHRAPRRIVTEAFLRPLVDDGQPVEYSAAELEALYRPIIEHHAETLRLYFGWYAYRVNTAAGIIRLVLRRLGLTLKSDRRRVEGERVKFYRLDVMDYCAAVEIARAVVAQRVAERNADLAERVGLPVPKLQKPLYSPLLAVLGQPLHPTPEPGANGWAAHPALFDQRIAALTAPIGARV